MTSTSNIINNNQQLLNGGEEEEEDPSNKSGGRVELKIEKLTEFLQEKLNSKRLSDPVYVRGVSWKIFAQLRECGPEGQKQKCLGYYLICNDRCADPIWGYFATAQLKIMAQKRGKSDHVRKFSHIFNAKEPDWGFAQFMPFEHIMKPDRGWYDAQADSIVLAVDLAEVCEYVVIAQTELILNKIPMSFLMQIGHLQWEVNFDFDDQQNKQREKLLVLTCKDVAKASRGGGVDKVLLELFSYQRNASEEEAYSPLPMKSGQHHLFTSKNSTLTDTMPGGGRMPVLFTFRVLKARSEFPNFTKEPPVVLGRNTTNVTLRVGDQQFHVNKQLLSAHALFFDRMFHGDYTAATQQEVELSLITHSPELFHQFLLVMCVTEVLPNSMNVAALFKLADFYDAENVRQKCDQHLRLAREMPIEKRALLARDHGSKETRTRIMDSLSVEQLKTVNLMLMENRSL